MLGKELNKYCSEFFDKDAIVNSLKINKFLCLIIFAFCVLNLLVCFSDLPDKIFIVDIIKNYTYNPLFYILILVPLLIINLNYSLFNKINNSNYGDSSNLKNSNKFKKLNKLNIIFTGLAVIYLILAILSSFSNTIILSGWTDVFPDSKLFLLIFILYVVGLICLVFKRFITLAHILGILTFILGFTGFLYYSPAASNLLSLSLNYLIFIVGISYLLLTTYPEEGITKIFILVSSGSKSAKKVVYLVAIFSALICLVIVYINDVTSVFLEEGALTSGFFMTLIIILMIYYSYKVSLADIYIKLANRRTYENKIFFEDLIKNMDDGVIVTNKDLNIIYANKCVLEYLNEDLSIVGKNIFKSSIPFLEDSIDEISKSINNSESVFIESKEGHNIDGSNYFKNNNDSNKKCSPFLTGWCSPRIKKGNFEGCIFTLIDITSEKQKESILKHSIKEKNIILAEVHHRVKNNMQIISSLLNLQSYNIDDNYTKGVIKESQNRIKTMALVHEYLYQNIDLSTIKVDVYISSLVDEIKSSYDISNKINFEVDVISESFDLDTLIPLGLIVNELLTNSIKYAFPNNKIDLNKENLIRISLMKDQEQYLLSVSDNGVGFDSSIVSKGIGRELINSLVQQIDGVYESVQDNGVTINIYFKI